MPMELLTFSSKSSKESVFESVVKYLADKNLNIDSQDMNRPWGGFLVIDENQINTFKKLFFEQVNLSEEQLAQKLSPKILLVAPKARLSWQYHFRRAELWKLIGGESEIIRSETDVETPAVAMKLNEVVSLAQGERHRLIGSECWGVVAEIWMHTDPADPSNEEDIVRVSDDYSRK